MVINNSLFPGILKKGHHQIVYTKIDFEIIYITCHIWNYSPFTMDRQHFSFQLSSRQIT